MLKNRDTEPETMLQMITQNLCSEVASGAAVYRIRSIYYGHHGCWALGVPAAATWVPQVTHHPDGIFTALLPLYQALAVLRGICLNVES